MHRRIVPRKSLGQNFLIDGNIAGKIVELAKISADDLIIEVGPGQGILTQFFLTRAAPIVAIELDSRCVAILKDKFGGHERLTILNQDFLEFDFDSLDYTGRQVKLVGNLPYHITSSVFFRLLAVAPLIGRAVFMIQKEVAQRIVSAPGGKEFGILAVLLQTFYEVKLQFLVSRLVFRPVPKVDSAVISLERRGDFQLGCAMMSYQKLIKRAFNQRRKLLRNALQSLIDRPTMEQLSFDFNRRAEQVPIEEWVNLCRQLEQREILLPG